MKLQLKIPPLALGIVALMLMWLLDRYIPLYGVEFMTQNIVACALMVIGVIVGLLGVSSFIKFHTTVDPRSPSEASSLVVVGIYKYSRNPMYLGILFVITGVIVYFGTLSTLIIIPAFIVFMNKYQIVPEEIALQEKFGSSYIQYTQKVRRWI